MTVVFYLVTAVACYKAGGRTDRGERRWWIAMAVGMLLLGINKELDLQSAVTEVGRIVARDWQFYDQRANLQIGFVLLLCAGLLVGTLAALYSTLAYSGALRLALLGAFVLGMFIVIRAASFHHVDRLLGTYFFGAKTNWLLEVGSIAIVLAAAMLKSRPAAVGPTVT
jgi:hypothetical protein